MAGSRTVAAWFDVNAEEVLGQQRVGEDRLGLVQQVLGRDRVARHVARAQVGEHQLPRTRFGGRRRAEAKALDTRQAAAVVEAAAARIGVGREATAPVLPGSIMRRNSAMYATSHRVWC